MKIKEDQIWREIDSRFERHIRIKTVSSTQVRFRTVINDGHQWVSTLRSRESVASITRFNGKSGGYALVRDT